MKIRPNMKIFITYLDGLHVINGNLHSNSKYFTSMVAYDIYLFFQRVRKPFT